MIVTRRARRELRRKLRRNHEYTQHVNSVPWGDAPIGVPVVYFELLRVLGFLIWSSRGFLKCYLDRARLPIGRHHAPYSLDWARLQVNPHYIVVVLPLFRFLQSLGGPAAAQSEGRALSGAQSEGA